MRSIDTPAEGGQVVSNEGVQPERPRGEGRHDPDAEDATSAGGPAPVPAGPLTSWSAFLTGPLAGLIVVVALLAPLIAWARGADELRFFVSVRNLQVIVYEATLVSVVALGALLVIVSGGIDLSVGSVVALGTVVTMQTYKRVYEQTGSAETASLAAIPAGVLLGGCCGSINGLVITRLRVSPFVTTLGMMSAARGLALWLTDRKLIAFPGGRPPGWAEALTDVHGSALLFNPGFWILVGLAGLMALVLRYHVLGRYAYALGSNESAARLCGVPVRSTKVVIYTVAGLLTGWAGVLRFASVGGDYNAGTGLELEVIAAVVIGGASLSGGQGSVAGTLLGVLLLGVLINGVRLLGMPVDVRLILIGVVIVISTALGRLRKRGGE